MSGSLLEDGREVPSVIKEIVIYDKPNKPYVSYEIFSPRSFERSYPSGDIVLSSSKKEVCKQEQHLDNKLANDVEIKSEPDDDDGELEEQVQQNSEEATEIGEETVNENTSDIEESIENISKEISKIERKQAPRRVKEAVERPLILRTYSRKKAQVVEKPQVKKITEAQPQQQSKPSTILNFLIKPLDQKDLLETNCGSSTDFEDAPETPQSKNRYTKEQKSNKNTSGKYSVSGGREKRTRRIPKKYQDDSSLDNLSVTCVNGDDDPPPASKKKKYTELKAVPYPGLEDADESSNCDNLEDLLSDGEQVKTKKLQKLAKKTKTQTDHEASDEAEQTIKLEEIDDNVWDDTQEDDDESDDSRQEWLPDEYVEYKRQHVLKNTAQVHKCKFCHKTFKSYYAMRKHRALDHDDLGKDTKESTFQPVEEEGEMAESDEESRSEWLPADYAEYKLKHKERRVQWYKCKICCSVFSTYYKLTKHRLDHEKQSNPYDCKQCDAKFNDVETFTAHIRNHQGKDPYSCKKCDKGFLSKHELIKHEEVHVLKKLPAAEKRFRCEVCSKEFHKLCDIERHTRVHTGEKPSQCTICQKRFQQPYNLSKHLLTHLNVKPFQCEICSKKFGRIDVLNRHLLTHSIEKPFKCIICGKGFIRQVQLNNHMDKSHPGLNNATAIDELSMSPVV
ncbi:zinc finger protein 43 isoform X1 [Dendroctonus ponderosae]|uniref:zinc finger protein 43 isoform X1 n=1 Tax=Dendroctonus ponderosae TaxID=77166 RepID=UPI0020361F82|nr:zinc finger protein 43 isoform X1 [Dendroctonus ponderosae]KAH1008977.1 hypothetical protein HUJ05_009463 [Dendroctonus ponderosae]